ncbi:hypothetical protein ONS95_009986 [Cadophora gregata]|uniref:uncharacterized protein n=1 Tax=Cadophora gregata TaxID=51156 RepID=UPI0026DB7F31|nr:uncharacterized protein ONS95_009986 [Cadophora gregata]KAK0121701.1 hypothetical protein ONS95_009986 [Cadophora gregata]KAK0127178.1 hypothetical protein ONS96_006730 [Cadophora gregata f. sp. sojae]
MEIGTCEGADYGVYTSKVLLEFRFGEVGLNVSDFRGMMMSIGSSIWMMRMGVQVGPGEGHRETRLTCKNRDI